MQVLEKCGRKKTAVYELLRTWWAGQRKFLQGIMKRCHTHKISRVCEICKSKLTRDIIGYDANSLYLHCSGDVMSCGKDTLVVNKKPFDQKRIAKFSKDVLKGKVFGSAQIDIEVPD